MKHLYNLNSWFHVITSCLSERPGTFLDNKFDAVQSWQNLLVQPTVDKKVIKYLGLNQIVILTHQPPPSTHPTAPQLFYISPFNCWYDFYWCLS